MLDTIIIHNKWLISLKLEFNSSFRWDSMFDSKVFFFVLLLRVFCFEQCPYTDPLHPVWLIISKSYLFSSLHLHHYTRIHTQPLFLLDSFSSFCDKTCWLLLFQAKSLLVTLFNQGIITNCCRIFEKPKPISPSHWVRTSLTVSDQV